MSNSNTKRAFTMIELVFVVVIIGILSAVAIPKLLSSKDDASALKLQDKIAKINLAIVDINRSLAQLSPSTLPSGVDKSTRRLKYLCKNSTGIADCDKDEVFNALNLSKGATAGFEAKGNNTFSYRLGALEVELKYNEDNSGGLYCSNQFAAKKEKLCKQLLATK